MRTIFRVIYPFIIYEITANVIMTAAAYSFTVDSVMAHSIYWTAVSAVVASLILAVFYRRDCRMRGVVRKNRGIPKGLFYVVLLGGAVCVAGNNFITLIRLDELFPTYAEVAEGIFIGSVPVQLLCVGVLVPIAEEMVFRVLGFRRLRDDMGFMPAAYIAAALFAFYHGNVTQGAYAFILGFVIAYAYDLYDRPIVPILIHISANVFSVVLMALPIFNGAVGGVYLLVGMMVSLIIGKVCIKNIRFYGLTNY